MFRASVAIAMGSVLLSYGTAIADAPPKTIIEIRTSPLCTAFRESVVPAIAGLAANEGLIREGRIELAQWSHDSAQEGADGGLSPMDRARVEIAVNKLVKNLERIDDILNDKHRFPGKDDGTVNPAALHDALQAVEDGQRQTINELYGPVDTSLMAEMTALPAGGYQTARDEKVSTETGLRADVPDQLMHPSTPGGESKPYDDTNHAGPLSAASPQEQQLRIRQSEATLSTLVTQVITRCAPSQQSPPQ